MRSRDDAVFLAVLRSIHRAVREEDRLVASGAHVAICALLEIRLERLEGRAGEPHHDVRREAQAGPTELIRELVVLLGLDVRPLDRLERRGVHRLHRNGRLDVQARARERVDDRAKMLHRVLRVVQRRGLRVSVALLHLGDVLGDLDIALEDAEVRVAEGDEDQLVPREPFELGLDAIEVEHPNP